MPGRLARLSILISLLSIHPAPAQEKPTQPPPRTQYIILEGGGPDQGPGGDVTANIHSLKQTFGHITPRPGRHYAYGAQQIRLLTRSTAFLRAEIESLLDLAESTGVPIWLHLDPLYGWGSDTETKPEDAPELKFWNEHDMREWDHFPQGSTLPTDIPGFWFNWGDWCTPTPAVPALGSPRFVTFARKQLREGILAPLRTRLAKWQREDRRHLFAGINLGWEIHIPDYRHTIGPRPESHPIIAAHPTQYAGTVMPVRLWRSQLGYASLHSLGWTEDKLTTAAEKEGITRDARFQAELYRIIHTYQENLARECTLAALSPHEVYSHIVALASTAPPNTNHPPIWTAVNKHSTPGFTMDQHGAARYHLPTLLNQIRQASATEPPGDKTRHTTPGEPPAFGIVETYFRLGDHIYATDADTTRREIETLFTAGARVQVYYAGFPLEERTPQPAIQAIKTWLSPP